MAKPKGRRRTGARWLRDGARRAGNDKQGRLRSARGYASDDALRHELKYRRRLMSTVFAFLAKENGVNLTRLVAHLHEQGYIITKEQAKGLVDEMRNGH